MATKAPDSDEHGSGSVDVADIVDQLDTLHATVDTPEEHREVQRTKAMVQRLSQGVFGENINKYTTRDIAEAFVGSIVFLIPLLVEDGVFEIAEHFLTVTVAGWPIFLVCNVAFVVVLTGALIYWSDIQRVDVATYVFGVPVPRRLLMTLVIALLTAAVMMTLWGRVEGWTEPSLALSRIIVVWTAAALGAALGDLLPGESTGTDITRALETELSELFERSK